MTGLRVAFDLDGVLANLDEPYQAARRALSGGEDARPASVVEEATDDEPEESEVGTSRVRGLTRQQQSDLWRRIARVPDF